MAKKEACEVTTSEASNSASCKLVEPLSYVAVALGKP